MCKIILNKNINYLVTILILLVFTPISKVKIDDHESD